MSNYLLVEKTKNKLENSDMLIATSIIGSFVILAFKSINSDRIKVFHKINKNNEEDDYLIKNNNKKKKSYSLEKRKKNKGFINKSNNFINSLNFANFNEKTNRDENKFKNSNIRNLIGEEKQLRIESPIFTTEEYEELKRLAFEGKNEKKMIKEEGDITNEEEEVWQLEEFSAKNFDLENVYKDLIKKKNNQVSLRNSIRDIKIREESEDSFENESSKIKIVRNKQRVEKFKKNKKKSTVEEKDEEGEEFKNNDITRSSLFFEEITKKNYRFEKDKNYSDQFEVSCSPLEITSLNFSKKFKNCFKNHFNIHESPIIYKEVAEERQELISSLNFNVVLDIRDKFYMLGSIKILLKLKEIVVDKLFIFKNKILIIINKKKILKIFFGIFWKWHSEFCC